MIRKKLFYKKNWLYGIHVVCFVLKNLENRKIFQIWLTEKTQKKLKFYKNNIPYPIFLKKSKDFLSKFGNQAVHQGCAIETTSLNKKSIKDIISSKYSFSIFVILDQIMDPYNVGAILRSSAVFGANAVIISDRYTVSNDSPILAKSACGAIELCPLIRVSNLGRTLDFLKEKHVWCYGLDEKGKNVQNIFPIKLKNKISLQFDVENKPIQVAFILGSEGDGLRQLIKKKCDFLISLPIQSKLSTLNVSVASAIAVYTFSLYFNLKKK